MSKQSNRMSASRTSGGADSRASDIQCPTCGYYWLGKGGFGCIDKPSLLKLICLNCGQSITYAKVAQDCPNSLTGYHDHLIELDESLADAQVEETYYGELNGVQR